MRFYLLVLCSTQFRTLVILLMFLWAFSNQLSVQFMLLFSFYYCFSFHILLVFIVKAFLRIVVFQLFSLCSILTTFILKFCMVYFHSTPVFDFSSYEHLSIVFYFGFASTSPPFADNPHNAPYISVAAYQANNAQFCLNKTKIYVFPWEISS